MITKLLDAITLALRVWSFMQARRIFERQNEIDAELRRLSVGASESDLLRAEGLGKERSRNAEFISAVFPDKHDNTGRG